MVDYKQSDLEVFLNIRRPDLFGQKNRGWKVAFCLYLAIGLQDREKLNEQESILINTYAAFCRLFLYLKSLNNPKARIYLC